MKTKTFFGEIVGDPPVVVGPREQGLRLVLERRDDLQCMHLRQAYLIPMVGLKYERDAENSPPWTDSSGRFVP